MKIDFQRLFKAIGDILVEALRPITAKLGELEARTLEKGERGERGEKGDPGALGERGAPGEKGAPGIDGERGEKGIPGERGEQGLKGGAGERGESGLKGDRGDRGEPGLKGDAGERGEHGEKGESGQAGAKGDQGPQGAKGEIGTDGARGEKGESGQAGAKGDQGPQGARGEPGTDGAPGEKGEAGKSVSVEDILPVLDGAVAKWMLQVERRIMDMAQRAVESMPRPRDGKDGVDGINADEFDFKFDLDTRTFSARHKDRVLFSQRIPYPKYCDVWSDRFGTYEEGLLVTFGGSIWIAKRDTTSKPGTDDSWQLAVKKGRDGK